MTLDGDFWLLLRLELTGAIRPLAAFTSFVCLFAKILAGCLDALV